MRSPAEGRVPVAVCDQSRPGRVGDIENGQPPIAPGGEGEVTGYQSVVECVALARGPGWRLAACPPHAGQPPAAHDLGPRRIGQIDDGQDVVAELREVDGGVGVASARVPEPMGPDALHRHEADLARLLGSGDVEDPETGAERARAPLQLVGRRGAEVVLLVLELLHGPDARAVDGDEEILVGLQVNGPRVGGTGYEVDGPGMARVAHVQDGDAVAERVADVGVAAMDHDLDAVAAPALVGMADEPDVARGRGVHDRFAPPCEFIVKPHPKGVTRSGWAGESARRGRPSRPGCGSAAPSVWGRPR